MTTASALDEIARAHGIRLLLQFGSTVTGRVHPRSDVDLGVVRERADLPLADHASLLHDLQGLFPGQEVDLAILNRADPLFLGSRVDQAVAERFLERIIGRMIDIPEYLRLVYAHLARVG